MGVSKLTILMMAVAIASGTVYLCVAQSARWESGDASRASLVFGACVETKPNVSQNPSYRAFCKCYADEMVARLERREQDTVIAALSGQGRAAVAASVRTMSNTEQVQFTERTKQFVASAGSRCIKAAAAVTELGEPAQ